MPKKTKKPKYANYTELLAAFKGGELTPYHYILIDKGGSYCGLRYWNPDASEEENEAKRDECSALFDSDANDGTDAIEALFDALGIPHQPA